MDFALQRETECLTRTWMQYRPEMLQDYLVASVEDPRLNVQSILTRHFLARALFGELFAELMEQELRFAVVLGWLRKLMEQKPKAAEWRALQHALGKGADDAEGIPVPSFVSSIFRTLPARTSVGWVVPNYVETVAAAGPADSLEFSNLPVLNLFVDAWRRALARKPPVALRVLEPACGSANDYRFIHASGLGRLLDYTGIDLCETNIANARQRFPQVRFEVGNVFEIPAPNGYYDCAYVHDLFEHLSVKGVETAVAELCRVTRRGCCVGFFNMADVPEHLVRPVDEYHWNTLSIARMEALFAHHGFASKVMPIRNWLRSHYGFVDYHNPNAHTLIVLARF